MSNAAFELIKVIELEISGIRDGNGYWNGSDAMGGALTRLMTAVRDYDDVLALERLGWEDEMRKRAAQVATDPDQECPF
jgi:hypothetical protein